MNAYDRMYAVIRKIPRGRVATYGQVAALAGYPHAPRLAGYALHALPEGSPLPWHRVVGAGGRLSLARLSDHGALTQRLRLEREGVAFGPGGRVDLARHAYRAGARATAIARRGTGSGTSRARIGAAPKPRRRASPTPQRRIEAGIPTLRRKRT